MPAAIARISPGRGRAGDLVLLDGSGFSTTPGQNKVTFDGVPAGVNTNAEDQLQVVIPVAISADQHVQVSVTNLDDATSAVWYWWSKDTILNTDSMVLRTKVPGVEERLRGLARTIANNSVAEARFFERIATKIELIRDMLDAKGNLWSRAAVALGVRQALAGTIGQPFVSAVDDTGGQFQDRQCSTLWFGGVLDTALLTDLMVPNSADNPAAVLNSRVGVIPVAGQIALASIRERLSVSSRVNRIEFLVNDVVVLDLQNGDPDFPGPGIRNGQSLTFYPGLRVSQGDRVSLRVSRNNTFTDCLVLAYLLVV